MVLILALCLVLLFTILLFSHFWVSFFSLCTLYAFLVRRLEVLIYIICMMIAIQSPKIYIFDVSVPYSYFFLFLFIVYYFLFYVEKIGDFFDTVQQKNFLALFALVFFVFVFSQIQSIHITFPITTIRQHAALNYPFIKSSIRLLQLFALFVFAFCISHAAQKVSWKKAAKIHTTVATALSVFLLLLFVFYFIFPDTQLFEYHIAHGGEFFIRLSGFFQEPGTLALYLLTSIPILFASLAEDFSRRKAIGLSLQLLCLFFTFSRSGWLAFIIMLPFLCLFFFKDIWQAIHAKYSSRMSAFFLYRKIGFIFMLVCFMFVVITLSYQPVGEIVERTFLEPVTNAFTPNAGKFWSTRLRLEAYSIAIHAFQEYPFLGIGIFNFHFYGGVHRYDDIIYGFYLNYSEVNNLFLSLLVEVGILGFCVLFYCSLLFLRQIYQLIKRGNRETSLRARGLLLGYIGIAVIMLFISTYTFPFLWFFQGLAIALHNEQEITEAHAKGL